MCICYNDIRLPEPQRMELWSRHIHKVKTNIYATSCRNEYAPSTVETDVNQYMRQFWVSFVREYFV